MQSKARKDLIARVRRAESIDMANVHSYYERLHVAWGLGPTDQRALAVLLKEPLTAAELRLRCGINSAATTALIDRLEQRGYVQRTPHGSDRRKKVIKVTKDATQAFVELITPFRKETEMILGSFSETELKTISSFLEKRAQVLEAQLASRVDNS